MCGVGSRDCFLFHQPPPGPCSHTGAPSVCQTQVFRLLGQVSRAEANLTSGVKCSKGQKPCRGGHFPGPRQPEILDQRGLQHASSDGTVGVGQSKLDGMVPQVIWTHVTQGKGNNQHLELATKRPPMQWLIQSAGVIHCDFHNENFLATQIFASSAF